MNSGKFRHKIEIQNKVVLRNEVGEEEVTWTPLCYPWASIEPLSGREYFAARQTQATTSHKITMRYQSGIHPYHRIQWDDRIFNIDAILNKEEKNIELVIMATEAT